MHAGPVHSGQKRGELGRVHAHDAVNDGRPFKGAVLEPLPIQNEAAAIPDEDLDAVGALGSEHDCNARKRVLTERLLGKRGQAIGAFAEIDRPRSDQHSQARRRRQHQRLRRKAENTSASASAPGRPPIRTLAPAISTSMETSAAADAAGAGEE